MPAPRKKFSSGNFFSAFSEQLDVLPFFAPFTQIKVLVFYQIKSNAGILKKFWKRKIHSPKKQLVRYYVSPSCVGSCQHEHIFLTWQPI